MRPGVNGKPNFPETPAMSEFIENAGNLDTDELMERCMQAREKLVGYATFVTNIMQVRR